MNLADIIRNITGGKASKRTAAELRADLAAIDLVALEAKVTEVEIRRRDLLLTGSNEELRAITEELSQANLDAERGQAAVDELNRLIGDAAKRESRAAIEQTAAEARAARERLIGRYAEIDRLASAMADALAAIATDHTTIKQANQTVLAAGRSDLKTSDPRGELALLLGVVNADLVPDPVSWRLGNYWPRTDAVGTPIGTFHPLSRIAELQPTAVAPRKAA